MISFRVDGVPVPQGSARAFLVGGRAKVAPSNTNALRPWRKAVTEAAREAVDEQHEGVAMTGPVVVFATFFLPRPKTVTRELPTVRPDLDKLARALGDGMADAGVFVEDAQIVGWHVLKEYGDPGVTVQVAGMDASAAGAEGDGESR